MIKCGPWVFPRDWFHPECLGFMWSWVIPFNGHRENQTTQVSRLGFLPLLSFLPNLCPSLTPVGHLAYLLECRGNVLLVPMDFFSYCRFHRIRKSPSIHSTPWSLYSNEDECMTSQLLPFSIRNTIQCWKLAWWFRNPGSLQTAFITTRSLNSRKSSDLLLTLSVLLLPRAGSYSLWEECSHRVHMWICLDTLLFPTENDLPINIYLKMGVSILQQPI